MQAEHDIFVSYARADRDRVEMLCRLLDDMGWNPWWDPKIPVGEAFDRTIARALAAAKVVLVIWSVKSIDSDWVLNEAEDGRRRGILVPILIDPIEIPIGFRRIQTANLIAWNGDRFHPEASKLISGIVSVGGEPPKRTRMTMQEFKLMTEGFSDLDEVLPLLELVRNSVTEEEAILEIRKAFHRMAPGIQATIVEAAFHDELDELAPLRRLIKELPEEEQKRILARRREGN